MLELETQKRVAQLAPRQTPATVRKEAQSSAAPRQGAGSADGMIALLRPQADPTPLVIYIGGAADDWVTHIVESYAAAKGGLFKSWSQLSSVAAAMKDAAAKGRPIAVVGHSLGGSCALGAAAKSGVFVDLVITIDPVGSVHSFDRSRIGYWANVTAAPDTKDFSDRIAKFGGKTSAAITGQADQSLVSKAHHGYFPTMMSEIGADGLIESVKKKPPKVPDRE